MPRVFISTAETSAERHAAHLLKALGRMVPDLGISAAGGELLAGLGADLAVDMSGRAVMGFWDALPQLAFYRRAADTILRHLAERRHDALILVDAPSFHLHLAKKVHDRWPDLPILYYIAPKLWAWKEWRAANLRRDIARTLCIFPFEEEFFRERGVDAVYVGNPTLDQVRGVDGKGMTRILHVEDIKRHSDPTRGVLAVFPGSRASEVKYLWPLMVKTMEMLRGDFPLLKMAVAVAPGWNRQRFEACAPAPAGVDFIEGDSQELLAASSVVLAKSGTTTLEAALLGKPMVVCYMGHAISYHIARVFVKIPFAALPNILAGKMLVKEFIQSQATPANLAAEIAALLSNQRYYRKMRSKLLALRDTLGSGFAADRAAREVARFLPVAIEGNEHVEK